MNGCVITVIRQKTTLPDCVGVNSLLLSFALRMDKLDCIVLSAASDANSREVSASILNPFNVQTLGNSWSEYVYDASYMCILKEELSLWGYHRR